MKYFITGGTGYMGENLVQKLLQMKQQVVVLMRPSSTDKVRLQHEHLTYVSGDILDYPSLISAMKGCDYVFHLAALATVWAPSVDIFRKVNVKGTENVLRSALYHNIKKFVFTSTAGVMSPSSTGTSDEESPRNVPFFNAYELTKNEAETTVIEFVQKGLKATIVNPTRVFGPGNGKGNIVSDLIKRYIKENWRVIPGDGKSIGNYVFIENVVNGHILAMQKGTPGERYILGGENLSYNKFFEIVAQLSGIRRSMLYIPIPLIMMYGYLQLLMATLSNHKPLITPQWIKKYKYDWKFTSRKATTQLGYQPGSFLEGLKKTIAWIRENDE